MSAASPTRVSRKNHARRTDPAPSAHWGRALRSILVSPRRGFARALRLSRNGEGGRARVVLVTLLAGLGAAHILLVFLKIRGLTGFRPVSPEETQFWGGLGLAILAAAATGVIAHVLFGIVSPPVVSRLGKRAESRELRTVWGLAGFPAAAGFLLLVVLDVLIAGREAYSAVDGDSLVTGWAAASLAIALSFGVWSLYLFVQGLRVATDVPPARSIMVLSIAVLCLAVATVLGTLVVVGVVSLVGLLVNVVQAVNK